MFFLGQSLSSSTSLLLLEEPELEPELLEPEPEPEQEQWLELLSLFLRGEGLLVRGAGRRWITRIWRYSSSSDSVAHIVLVLNRVDWGMGLTWSVRTVDGCKERRLETKLLRISLDDRQIEWFEEQ